MHTQTIMGEPILHKKHFMVLNSAFSSGQKIERIVLLYTRPTYAHMNSPSGRIRISWAYPSTSARSCY